MDAEVPLPSQPPPAPRGAPEGQWASHALPRVALRLLLNGLSHPIQHAKVLIQLGYEPVKPYDSHRLLGTPARALPNVFEYVAHIREQYGLGECYRGLVPKMGSNIVSAIVFHKVSLRLHEGVDDSKDDEGTQEERRRAYCRRLLREAGARALAVAASHPLHVIAVRSMAQTVGREGRYSGLYAPLAVYQDSGFGGFFQGLAPRLLGEMLALAISTLLAFAVNHYVVDDRDVRYYLAAALSFVASSVTYPFHVVSTCMAATNSGLIGASPPHLPDYSSWWQCWGDLWASGQISRGSGLFWRFASPGSATTLLPVVPTTAPTRHFRFFRRKTEQKEL